MNNVLYCGMVQFPVSRDLCVNMMPFVMGEPESIPTEYRHYVPLIEACDVAPQLQGKVGFLSIHESFVEKGKTQRRSGLHTEGHPRRDWGGGWGKRISGAKTGGLYMASSIGASCRVWDMHIEPCSGGDCEPLRAAVERAPSTDMQANALYWMHDRTPHESLSALASAYRQWFRLVAGRVDVWFSKHSSANRLGVKPGCRVIDADKFAAV